MKFLPMQTSFGCWHHALKGRVCTCWLFQAPTCSQRLLTLSALSATLCFCCSRDSSGAKKTEDTSDFQCPEQRQTSWDDGNFIKINLEVAFAQDFFFLVLIFLVEEPNFVSSVFRKTSTESCHFKLSCVVTAFPLLSQHTTFLGRTIPQKAPKCLE